VVGQMTTSFTRTYSTTTQLSEKLVLLERHMVNGTYSGVAFIKLNKPAQFNALSFEMGADFKNVVDELSADKQLKCVILTGQGNAFSAGGDLSFLMERSKDTPQNNAEIMERFYRTFLYIRKIEVPIISAINGPAIGAGMCLAMATDLRLISSKARMGVTFVDLGIHPGMAATHFMPRLLGHQVASRLMLTGDVIQGEEAKRLGVVLDVVEPDNLIPASLDLALRIAKKSSIAVQSCLKTLRNQQNECLDQSLTREAGAQAMCYASTDIVEGVTAIKEKRPPR
ncbi:hypothetical protein SAMD00019534_058630, partial [Acytostelium subglobosum LB1]|uniref:hypothetical protein n=1 Tax=Acytostelium subglobosum LB1 TaxID=1410327 RepID=UPI000645021A